MKEIIKEPAINEPLITPGDKILLVNGIDVSSLSHSGAISFLRGLPNTVTLRLEPALPFEDITKDVIIVGSIDGRRPDHAQRSEDITKDMIGSIDGRRPDHVLRKGVKQLRHEARMMIKEKSTDSLSRLKQRKEKSRGRLTQAINYDVNEDANGDANGDANSSYGDANSSNYSTLNRSDASRASTDCQASDSSSFASDFKETPNQETPNRETPNRETPNEVAPKSGSDSNHRHKIVIHSSPVDLAKVNRNESIDGVSMQKIIVNHSSASLDTNLASLGTNSAPKMVSESKNPFHDSSLRTGSSDMDSIIKSSLCHNLSDDHLLAAAQNADANDSEPVASFAKWRGANLAGWDIGPPVGAVGGVGRTSDEADSGFGGDNDWTPKTTLEKPLTTQDMEAINELMNESSDDTHAQEANVSDSKLTDSGNHEVDGAQNFIEVTLDKGWTSRLGIILKDDSEDGAEVSPVINPNGCVVKDIFPNTVASSDGRIKPGFKLLSVNDVEMKGKSSKFVIDLLRKMRGKIKMKFLIN